MRYYKWTLTEDKSIPYPDISIEFENDFVKVSNGVLTVKANYTWDGCTPKRKIFGLVIGTWDGFMMDDGTQQCYLASLFHDALYQYKIGDRKVADTIFLNLMKTNKFILRRAYYGTVRLIGGVQWNKSVVPQPN